MLPTVVDLWPDCDLLAIDDGVTVVMVAEWDSRIVVDGVCVGHSQVLFLISTVQSVSYTHLTLPTKRIV